MAGIPARPYTFFRVGPTEIGKAQCFAIKWGDTSGLSLGANFYTPQLQSYLDKLSSNPAATKPLSAYVDINPSVDVSSIDPNSLVGFVPMQAVYDDATGEYTVTDRPISEVSSGYTPFINGDILWAKITPCMQNGKSCIVDGLTNGVGFGSTEFHVLRVSDTRISRRFVFEFVSQEDTPQSCDLRFHRISWTATCSRHLSSVSPFPGTVGNSPGRTRRRDGHRSGRTQSKAGGG